MVIDFDDVPGPYRFDPCDGELAAIYCRTLLPEPWRRAPTGGACRPRPASSLACGSSSPSGSTGQRWARRLERHLKGCPIDASTLRAVQPIYVARPILVGVADPIRQRTGVEHDIDDVR